MAPGGRETHPLRGRQCQDPGLCEPCNPPSSDKSEASRHPRNTQPSPAPQEPALGPGAQGTADPRPSLGVILVPPSPAGRSTPHPALPSAHTSSSPFTITEGPGRAKLSGRVMPQTGAGELALPSPGLHGTPWPRAHPRSPEASGCHHARWLQSGDGPTGRVHCRDLEAHQVILYRGGGRG